MNPVLFSSGKSNLPSFVLLLFRLLSLIPPPSISSKAMRRKKKKETWAKNEIAFLDTHTHADGKLAYAKKHYKARQFWRRFCSKRLFGVGSNFSAQREAHSAKWFWREFPARSSPREYMLEKSSFTRKILQEKLFFSPLPATWGEGRRCGISEKCRNIGEEKKKIVLREKGEALLAFSLRSWRKAYIFLFWDTALQ